MRRQRFGEQRVLITFFQRLNRKAHKFLRFLKAALGKQCSCSRLINLGDHSRVTQVEKETTSAIEMLVCFLIFPDSEEQETKIVLDASDVAYIPSLLKVEACSRV